MLLNNYFFQVMLISMSKLKLSPIFPSQEGRLELEISNNGLVPGCILATSNMHVNVCLLLSLVDKEL